MCGSTSEPVTAISASSASSNFLTAEWRDLVMINYEVGPEILASRVPAGTALDVWHGRAIVTAVGFQFLDTRVRGIAVPFHRDFDEVNLRLYVQRRSGDEIRLRGGVRHPAPLGLHASARRIDGRISRRPSPVARLSGARRDIRDRRAEHRCRARTDFGVSR
jgi:uncharacterized protein YqjF (DUF2071 family)